MTQRQADLDQLLHAISMQSLDIISNYIRDGRLPEAFVRLYIYVNKHRATLDLKPWSKESIEKHIKSSTILYADFAPILTGQVKRLPHFPNLGPETILPTLSALDEILYERPRSHFDTIDVDGTSMWLVPRMHRPDETPRHYRQFDSNRALIPHFYIFRENIQSPNLPDTSVVVKQSDVALTIRLERVRLAKKVTCAAEHFNDGAEPIPSEKDGRLDFLSISDPDIRLKSIHSLLAKLNTENVNIALIPELSTTEELFPKIAEAISTLNSDSTSLILFGVGSYYEHGQIGTKHTAKLLDWRGRTVLRHEKCRRFTDPRKGTREDFEPGTCIELLLTPIGTIAMPICLDFSDEVDGFNSRWNEIGVDWILVPSRGDKHTISAHRRQAAHLARAHGSISIVANQPTNQEEQGSDAAGFIFPNESSDVNRASFDLTEL